MSEKIKTITNARFYDLKGNEISFKKIPRNKEILISGEFKDEKMGSYSSFCNNVVTIEKARCILRKDNYITLTITGQKFSFHPKDMLDIKNAIDIFFEKLVILSPSDKHNFIITDENIGVVCKPSCSQLTLYSVINLFIQNENLNVFLRGTLYESGIRTESIYTRNIKEVKILKKNNKSRLYVKDPHLWYHILNIFN